MGEDIVIGTCRNESKIKEEKKWKKRPSGAFPSCRDHMTLYVFHLLLSRRLSLLLFFKKR